MLTTVTKMEAAGKLLNRAIDVYLDSGDCVSAIVLAGSAEDVLQGLLKLCNRDHEASRVQMFEGAQQIAQAIDPTGQPPSEKAVVNLMRGMFNWLRHGDKPGDQFAVTWDLDLEAETIIYRAIQNWDTLGGPEPPRAGEFVRATVLVSK